MLRVIVIGPGISVADVEKIIAPSRVERVPLISQEPSSGVLLSHIFEKMELWNPVEVRPVFESRKAKRVAHWQRSDKLPFYATLPGKRR